MKRGLPLQTVLLGTIGLALILCYLVALQAPAVGLYHDDGIYVVTAKALAEGQGYRIISLPDEIAQTKYPVLFPFLLSLIWRVAPQFPDNVMLLKLVPLAASIVWLGLAYLLLKRESENGNLAMGIVLLTAISPHVLFVSTALLSETVFAAFVWGGLLLLRRFEREKPTGRAILAAAIVCSAAFHTRTIGIALIVAGVLTLVVRRRPVPGLKFGFFSGILLLPWVWWIVKHGNGAELYSYYTRANYESWNLLQNFPLEQKVLIIGQNLLSTLIAPGFLLTNGLVALWPAYLAAGLLAVLGFCVSLRDGANVIHLFLILYVANVILWVWSPARFLIPVLPLLLLFAAQGASRTLQTLRLHPRTRNTVLAGGTLVAGFVGGWSLGRTIDATLRTRTVCYDTSCTRQDWTYYEQTFAWLERNAAPDVLLAADLDPMLYLYTGRKAVRAFEADPFELRYSRAPDRDPLGPPRKLLERLVQTESDYLVRTPSGWFAEEPFLLAQTRALEQELPGLLESVFVIPGTEFRIFRVAQTATGAEHYPAVIRGVALISPTNGAITR